MRFASTAEKSWKQNALVRFRRCVIKQLGLRLELVTSEL